METNFGTNAANPGPSRNKKTESIRRRRAGSGSEIAIRKKEEEEKEGMKKRNPMSVLFWPLIGHCFLDIEGERRGIAN